MRFVESPEAIASDAPVFCFIVADEVRDNGRIDWGFAAAYAPELFRGFAYGRIYTRRTHWEVEIFGRDLGRRPRRDDDSQFTRSYRDGTIGQLEFDLWRGCVALISTADFARLEPLLFPPDAPAHMMLIQCLIVRVEGAVPTCWVRKDKLDED